MILPRIENSTVFMLDLGGEDWNGRIMRGVGRDMGLRERMWRDTLGTEGSLGGLYGNTEHYKLPEIYEFVLTWVP